ncbi:MAG: 4Fe-4S dicluster domain-containing protein [Clostridia bacterium]|jgi:electron transport complex protein RnfC|nr:4Fe-4S dicluster domain-containing protein [Clostridia bacterium]
MQNHAETLDPPMTGPDQETVTLMPDPELARIPCQRQGLDCHPLVKVGDKVIKGQKIAETTGDRGAIVLSSVCGQVKEIAPFPNYHGVPVLTISVKTNGDADEARLPAYGSPQEMEASKLFARAHEAGLVTSYFTGEMVTVPLPGPDAQIKTILIQACPLETVFNVEGDMIIENEDDFLFGLEVLTALYPGAEIVVLETKKRNKTTAFFDQVCSSRPEIRLLPVELRPHEFQIRFLLQRLLSREVGRDESPFDCGVLPIFPPDIIALARAFSLGEPYIRQTVRVYGRAVKKPGGYRVPIGTSIGDLLISAGVDENKLAKVVVGCSLRGTAVARLDLPIEKGVYMVVAFSQEEVFHYENLPCIHCGRCVEICPVGLWPQKIVLYSQAGKWQLAEEEGVLQCLECGQCSFVCPAQKPLLQLIEVAKSEVRRLAGKNEEGRRKNLA